MAISLWVLATAVFFMLQLVPGDAARVAAGEHASPEQVAAVSERLGLDRSLPEQYLIFLNNAVHGDLGSSTTTFQPVVEDLAAALPSTVELVIGTTVLNLLIAIPLGTWAALRRQRRADSVIRVGAVVAGGVAPFWLALMIQYIFATKLGILPVSGQMSLGSEVARVTGMQSLDALLAGNVGAFFDALQYLVLPVVALALHFAAQLVRAMRTSLLAVLDEDYIEVVRAKGVSSRRSLLRHALPNALSPVVGLAALQIGATISLAILVEIVFARTGIGSYLSTAVISKDTYAVLATILFIGAVIALVNFFADIVQLILDPRVRHSETLGKS